MSANLNNVINVALLLEGQLAARDNMNVVALVTSQITGPINSANRYQLYSDLDSVATDFGTDSEVYQHATAFFGTQPNPTNAGGVLVIGFWRAADENVAASSAVVTGAQLTEASLIPQLQAISDGSFDIDVDGGTVNVTGIDLRAITTLEEVVALLNTAVTGATVTLSDDDRIIITSDTTGATSLLTLPVAGAAGTFLGALLGLATGTGATVVQGAAASVLSAETQVDALTALKALVNFKGFVMIDEAADATRKLVAAWAQANSVLGYETFDTAANLTVDVTNVVWDVKLSGYKNYRMQYSLAGNRRLATTYMSRVHVVNFNAENSALTMHLKELSVAAEEYTQTQITAAKTVGLDIYTTNKNVPIVLTSGANDFVDNRYNLIAFINAVQTDMFNLLKQTGTKIPQTQRGVNQLIDQAEKTTRGFVRAGVFAPGTWSSPDYFGDRDTFTRSIEERGFYWLAGSLADQPQVDRQDRKSPVLQCAVKNAGAFHSADIIINFNL